MYKLHPLTIGSRQFEINNQKTHDDLIKEIEEVNEELRTTLSGILSHLRRREEIGSKWISPKQQRLLGMLDHLMTIQINWPKD